MVAVSGPGTDVAEVIPILVCVPTVMRFANRARCTNPKAPLNTFLAAAHWRGLWSVGSV